MRTKLTQKELEATERAFREVRRDYSRQYYLRNIDKIKAFNARFYAEHQERLLEEKRKRRESKPKTEHDRKKNSERCKRYYWKNKEKIVVKQKEKYRLRKLEKLEKLLEEWNYQNN